ncbi:MAG: DNA-binding protein [Streptococcaceae bacterium]|jgi:predicted RNA-binding protein (virulence factor B family)|nr:DNA-binding protein [Streptococcaceae bacterium]
MNTDLGTTFTGVITDENEEFVFVQKNGRVYRLAKTEGEFALGQSINGFAYSNTKGTLSFTTVIPKSRVGAYAFGEVTNVRRDLGVFVDIGLPDKEIVVSMDTLPEMRELWPKEGDRLKIALTVDKKDRIWGELAPEANFRTVARKADEKLKNHDVTGTVFRLKIVGTYLLTEDFHLGFIHPSERFREPRLGEKITGRVVGVRPDGILNISLKPRAYESIEPDALMLLTVLEKSAEGKIPFTDKSTPEEIKNTFGISKGQFKRAIGNLLKQNKIEQKDGFTVLKESENHDSNEITEA